jgi:hypothetical protein
MKKWLTMVILGSLCLTPFAEAGIDEDLWTLMLAVNVELEKAGKDLRIEKIEYLTAGETAGREVFFSDRGNKQFPSHWVPGDPRREWSTGTDITWASDGREGNSGAGFFRTQLAIARAMRTWNDVSCSTIPLERFNRFGISVFDLGFIAYFFGIGPEAPIVADISHAGFGTVLDPFLPAPIIAATFTLIWVSPDGTPTDIDNNGRFDTALREIYYTNNFPWGIGEDIDVETVVLHETGHALSQAHFGKLFRTKKNGKFHFAPRAVMNAGYTGIQTAIRRSDNAGHCSIWASWPNR